MDKIISIIQTALPVLIALGLGVFCKKKQFVDRSGIDTLKKVVINITCDIHTREKTVKLLKDEGAHVYGLHEILTEPIGESGFNPDYGLLGSNKATEEKLKLFPRTGDALVVEVQNRLVELTGKRIEVMVYGDGAFKEVETMAISYSEITS